ncbi:MAG: tRNA lysidine(34) synthetase TilS, partial [Coriobacteriia bacterium]|nr:tRNA lysidine(34) synthetase TilS [Coriobacteriia bacterium]
DGLNLEDAGRRVRYRFAGEELDARCAAAGLPESAGRIAVAHTLDDRIETFLMRLATGSGAGGLAGMPHVRGRVVRPLLDARRADVVAYLDDLGQTWREDATNADTSRLRARVRAELLPLLESVNPRFDEALARMWTVLGGEDDLLDEMARASAADLVIVRPGEVRFDRARMSTLSRPMVRRILRSALLSAFPEASRIEFEHVEALADGLREDRFARDLPDGLRAHTEYATLVISRTPDGPMLMAPALLEVPGTVDLGPAGTMHASLCSSVPENDPLVAVIEADRLAGPLTVDSVRPGDRMRPLGMRGTRKLQDVLTDAKVPRGSRSLVPVVRDGERIVWVAGVRMSDEYAIGPGTVRAIRLEWVGPVTTEDQD